MNNNNNKNTHNVETVLNRISSRNSTPAYFFVVLLVFYLFSWLITSTSASMKTNMNIFGKSIPIYSFAGIFSSLSAISIIFIVFYFGKKGYLTALFLQMLQLISIFMSIVFKNNMTSLPGLFGSLLTIVAITIIYLNNKHVDQFQKQMNKQAVTDALTGLPNRYACSELIEALYSKKENYFITSIDLNGFKNINDTLGFDVGNEVLKEISNRWKSIADSGETGTLDFISRINGDEFALIIRNYNSEEQVLNTIKKYEQSLSKSITVENCDLYVVASFGYAEFPTDSDAKDFVFNCAENAMHEVKKINSSNHILRFTPDMLNTQHILEIESKILDALKNETIFFHLQPQFDINHKLRGFEALARMKDANGAFISPGEFIPIAESCGLIDKVDEMVFRKSASFFGEILKKTNADISLSINVSVKHLMKNDFIDEIERILKECNVPANKLEVEITESIMIDSVDKALKCIDRLKSMGIMIAIDDFGTGYSSLSYLNKFPANLLKIDKSFIDTMNTNKSSKQYVSAIISMGHIMGFDVISEGVEEEAQVNTLKEIGCDFIQGFIWGRPLPQEEAEKLVLNSVG